MRGVNMKRFTKAVLCSSIVAISAILNLSAQEIRVVEPISMIKSIESEDPLRFYNLADPGIPGGDINGDGVQEYIVRNTLYPDKSTPETGDFIDNTLIYNINANGEITYYSIRDGALFNPAGDLNGDGRDDLVSVVDGSLQIYSFGTGDFDISGELNSIFETDVTVKITQFVPGFDLDGDGHNDLLLGTYDYSEGSFFHIIFGGSSSEDFEFQTIDTFDDLGDLEILTNAGDLVGDDGDEVVLLTSTQWPYEFGVAVYEIDEERNITFTDSTKLLSGSGGASNMRFYVADVDGEYKDDLFFSDDRYSSGRGFTQIFFNDPVSHFFLSVAPDTAAGKSNGNQEGVMPDWANKQGDFGIGGNTTLDGTNGLHIVTWINGIFGVIPNGSISKDEALPEPDPIQTEEVDDYIFQPPYSTFQPDGKMVVGIGNPINWTARLGILSVSVAHLEVIFGLVNNYNSFYSEISETDAVEPNGTDIPIGLGIRGQWFPTQYLSLFAQAGLRLDFIGEDDEVSSPTTDEPTGSFIANGQQGVNTGNGATLFGGGGFTVWFNKERSSAPDTAELVHSINVTDFQEFGEDDNPNVFTNNIGDINNDGFDDILMSSGYSYSNNSPVNKAWLFYGGETYSDMPDYTFDFSQDSAAVGLFGTYITTKMEPLGDVNGDGIDDFALTSGGYGSNGGVYVFFGDADFYSTESEQTEFRYPDVILTPEVSESQTVFGFGQDISSGDFNGDGILDIAVTMQTGYGTPTPATIHLFYGGESIDGNADMFLTATRNAMGDMREDMVVSGITGSTVVFLPLEDGKTSQDLLFTPGGLSGYTDAIIFEGGVEADSLADISLRNPNRTTGFGAVNGSKPGVGDLNDDGFYDILLLVQQDYEDAFVSSRVYAFSPNADIIIDSNEDIENPFGYRLSQNYPNPFNPSTKIEFRLGSANTVTLKVFDVLGREVYTLIEDARFSAGSHTINFDASGLASGVYLYKLEAQGFTQTRKMMLIK